VDIVPIPAFNDNYIWLLRSGRDAVVVDPGDAAPVLEFLGRNDLRLGAVLLTHHHADHVGGVEDLLDRFQVEVYGPAAESIPSVSRAVSEADRVRLPRIEVELNVLEIPGHTRGHVAYYGANLLFCGDTLFSCGCGRLFEGTPEQMLASLDKLSALPPSTQVFCGHEYTHANCRFALAVEPENDALRRREHEVAQLRAKGIPTLPSSIGVELQTNPFLRSRCPAVRAAVERYRGAHLAKDADVFAALRKWKNSF
jgi:hydroxyacylglutathione hydrolase